MDHKRKPFTLFNLFGLNIFQTVHASDPCKTSDPCGDAPDPCSQTPHNTQRYPCGDYSPPAVPANPQPRDNVDNCKCQEKAPKPCEKPKPPPPSPAKCPPPPPIQPTQPTKSVESVPPPSPPPPTPQPSPKGVSDLGKSGAGVTGARTEPKATDDVSPQGVTDLGLLRHIHNAARLRIPHCFEGAQFTVKSTTSDWIFGHTFSFSSVSPGGYKLMLSYMDQGKPLGLPYFLMEAAPGGQTSCEMRVGPTDNTRFSVVAQIADAELFSFETIFDAYFKSATASVIAVNREFIAVHFLQKVTNSLDLGTEVVAKFESPELSSASAALRWAYLNNTTSLTIGNRGLDLCYSRAINDMVSVAALLEVGFASRQAVGTVAYEWSTDTWTVKGSADSDGLVGATLKHKLKAKHTDINICVSALLNHPNNKFRLGFGFTAAIKASSG